MPDIPTKKPKRKPAPEIPSRLTVLVGVLTFAGLALTIAAAPPWAAAAALGAALSACLFHRSVWRPHPSISGLAVVLTVTIVAGLVAHLALEGKEDSSHPVVNVERTASSIGSGQIEAGNMVRASLGGETGTYLDPLPAPLGATVTIAIRISNGGPDPLVGTHVSASIPDDAASSLSVEMHAGAPNANPSGVSDTATLEVKGNAEACLAYVSGTSRLFDQHFGLIRDLPDGVTTGSVPVGKVGVPISDVRFVGIELQLERPEAGGRCG